MRVRVIRLVLMLCGIWFSLGTGTAQVARQYLFRRVDSNSGLTENNVRDMLMLPNGMMCIQTSTRLNLFDGISSKSYRFDPSFIPYQEYAGLNYLFYNDNLLWFSHQDYTWMFDVSTREFEYDIDKLLTPFDINGERPESFYLSPNGSYWIVSNEGNIWYCNVSTGIAQQIDKPAALQTPLIIKSSGTNMWMLSLNGAFACYDTRLQSFTKLIPKLTASGTSSSRMEMVSSSRGDIWIMFDTELIRYESRTGRIEKIKGVPLGQNDVYTTIAMDSSDRLWIGSARSGVSILNTHTLVTENLEYLELFDGQRIGHNTDISKIYIDPQEGVWIATLTEGVFYWHKDIFRLQTINNSSLGSAKLPDENIKCIVEDADGTILLGTVNGLLRYDPTSGNISIPYPELANALCTGLYRDKKNRIWLGTFHRGAFCIDRGRIRHYFYDGMPSVEVSYHNATPNLNCVRSFYEDTHGNFWICVYGGIGRFDPSSGHIELLRDTHPEVEQFMLMRGMSEEGGKLLAVGDNGSYLYDSYEDTVTMDSPDADYRIPCNQSIEDFRGLVWLASSNGLYVIPKEGARYRLTMRDGLPNDNILGIVADQTGNIWAATFNSISRIKPIKGKDGYSFAITSFNEEDGMSIGTLFQNAIIVASDGRVYAGGSLGFCIADPATLYQRSNDSPPVITGLRIFNHPVEVGEKYDGRCILSKELTQTERIKLRHTETFLTFEFSNLNYINPSHTNYRYMLKNFDKDWTELHASETGSATYTLLNHGDYVFMVMAEDNDADWSGECAEVAITINPSFWQSVWSKVLYVLLFCIGAVLLIYSILRRMRKQAEFRQMEESQRQKDEMDQMKFRFFTNVSHELRTPLSLILLPLESIINDTEENSPLLPKLQTMRRNASSLLSMVNHLLDFRKLEMSGETLNYTHGDIAEFIETQVNAFDDTAHEKEVDLSFENEMTSSTMDFDATKVYKIVNNLLSNALKFTPKGGAVSVRMLQPERDLLVIEVADTGIGISAEDKDHIFERFYQSARNDSPQGTGIGLCLVKQYAEMLGGKVSTESEIGVGSTFRVELPINSDTDLERVEQEQIETQEEVGGLMDSVHKTNAQGQTSHRSRILVIEDNSDFRNYLAGELSAEFEVIKASDGEDGLKKATKHIIDIIICDVMMPRMDGFELCRRIKNDITTSHIPIILLTAHFNDDVRRKGYESGADAYLGKPFSMDVLRVRIRNLLEDRRRRIRDFTTGTEASSAQITTTPLDRRLMDKIIECVEKNIGNSEYSVENLADDVAMHRMNLYRKLRTITGTTPSEFLRTIRLKQAAKLLVQEPFLSVTEISEKVGFNTPKYFSHHFYKMFGCTPSHYRTNNQWANS